MGHSVIHDQSVRRRKAIGLRFLQDYVVFDFWFIFIRIKKGEGQGKEKCHTKSMMSKEDNERLKRDTQDVPLRQNTEEKIRERGLKVV
jgi:hypothetical protein